MATQCKIRYMKAVVKLGDVYISSTLKRLLQRDLRTSTMCLKDMAAFCMFCVVLSRSPLPLFRRKK